jgi:hypothetical protein
MKANAGQNYEPNREKTQCAPATCARKLVDGDLQFTPLALGAALNP